MRGLVGPILSFPCLFPVCVRQGEEKRSIEARLRPHTIVKGLNRLHKMCVPKSVPSQFVWSRRNAGTKVSVSLGGHFFYSTQNDLEQTLA